MENEQSEATDIAALVAEMAPPSIPEQGFGADNPDLFQVRGWNKIHASTVLAGLPSWRLVAMKPVIDVDLTF